MTHSIAYKSSEHYARLIAIFAHDIKAPLSGNAQLLELLLDNEFGELSQEAREAISVMLRSNLGMQHVLQTLVDLMQLETANAQLEMQPHSLGALLIEALSHSESPIPERTEMDVSAQLTVAGDSDLLKKLFLLLFKYSVNARDPKSKVSVIARPDHACARIDFHGVYLPLRNFTGSQELQENCTGAGRTRLPAGAALSLYLCALIVEAHHGTIAAERESDERTTMTVTLPVKQQ